MKKLLTTVLVAALFTIPAVAMMERNVPDHIIRAVAFNLLYRTYYPGRFKQEVIEQGDYVMAAAGARKMAAAYSNADTIRKQMGNDLFCKEFHKIWADKLE